MKIILFLLCLPSVALADIEAEFAAYSNFIWRGQTFTENKPALQGQLDYEITHGFYLGGFISNAEFDDPGMGADFKVTHEVDYIIGKRWEWKGLDVQFSYSLFTFPGAHAYNSDEWNLLTKFRKFTLELSYLDDYFGYHSTYRYVRVGHEWLYWETLQGGVYVGYSMFSRPKGNIYMIDGNFALDGAGSRDYVDVYFVNRKTLDNQMALELAINWTNRYEYSVNPDQIVVSEKARDLAVIVGLLIPVTL